MTRRDACLARAYQLLPCPWTGHFATGSTKVVLQGVLEHFIGKCAGRAKLDLFDDHWNPRIVGELNGRYSTRGDDSFPGTDTRGLLNLGGRYTTGPIRFDASFFFGLTAEDPTVGMTAGFTYVFNAFQVP